MNHKRIIFITALTLWSMGKGHGGPAFTQTVKKYIDEGWEVYLVSDEPGNRDYPALDSAHNICLPPSRFSKYCMIRKIGLFFRYLNEWTRVRRFIQIGRQLLKDHTDHTVLYAYEVNGVKASQKLSAEFSVPLVTRFQGTALYCIPNTMLNHIRRYPGFQALSTKADLVIMTDDGTFGDRTLLEVGNTSPTLFLRNGLELMGMDIAAIKAAFDRNAFRASLGVEEDEPMFLTVSRLVSWKRLDRSIDGFAAYCETHPTGRLVIVGGGDEQPKLEQRAESLGIRDRVVFTGSVAHDDVYQYMMACDIFLSLYDLGNVGNPLFEAMTLGKCIVALDTGNTRSVVRDGENAVLLTMETLPSLGRVLSELAEDSGRRQRLAAGAATYAKTHFHTWEQRMDTEFQAVSALLEKSAPK